MMLEFNQKNESIVSLNKTEPKLLSKNDLMELTSCFISIILIERDIETNKIELALKSDFNLVDAFKFFDSNGVGKISLQNLKDGIIKLNVDSTGLYSLFKRIDLYNNGYISFHKFGDLILPYSEEYA